MTKGGWSYYRGWGLFGDIRENMLGPAATGWAEVDRSVNGQSRISPKSPVQQNLSLGWSSRGPEIMQIYRFDSTRQETRSFWKRCCLCHCWTRHSSASGSAAPLFLSHQVELSTLGISTCGCSFGSTHLRGGCTNMRSCRSRCKSMPSLVAQSWQCWLDVSPPSLPCST